jgi:hypothetical protein
MFATMIKKGLVMGALVGGVAVAGVGPASAATTVGSDKISYSGVVSSTGAFQSNQCFLTSDKEPQRFPCQVKGQLTPGPAGLTINGTIDSPDGHTTFGVPVTVGAGGSFAGKGKGTEADTPDPGQPPPPAYPCVVKAAGTLGGSTIAGTFKVKELSTRP